MTRTSPSFTDHTLADDAVLTRDFACLACVSHLTLGGVRELRRLPGVTGVIDSDDTADVQLVVHAESARAAKRVCVELVATVIPEAVVSVPEVIDYDEALVDHFDRLGGFTDDPHAEEFADFDDIMAVAEALDT